MLGLSGTETANVAITSMTSVLINAISVKEGGSLIVLQNLLAEMVLQRPGWQWHVAMNSVARARFPALPNTTCHVFTDQQLAGWKMRWWYETCLPRLIRQVQADLLFSHTNYLPVRHLPCPALLLVQHAGHFSTIFKRLTEERFSGWPARVSWRLKGGWVKSSVRRAQCVTVQTDALAQRIVEETDIPRNLLCVIPHGAGQAILREHCTAHPGRGEQLRIGYITKYGVQKNFSVLFKALAELKLLGVSIVLVLTLSPEIKENQEVLRIAEYYDVLQFIENHGELAAAEIDALYRSLHVFVFPSLCESFGFPMVEAMSYGLPLLISDTDSNMEVAGEAGIRFKADDVYALAASIFKLIEDPLLARV
jgi:glycosyltransferase involved in cell wall biosynthesis